MKFDVFSTFLQHGFDMFLLKIFTFQSFLGINKRKQQYKVLPFAISHKMLWCVFNSHTGIPYQGRSTWTPKRNVLFHLIILSTGPFNLHPCPSHGSLFPTLIRFSFSATTGNTVPPFQNLVDLKHTGWLGPGWLWVWLPIWLNLFNAHPCCNRYHNCFIHLFMAIRNTSYWAFKPFQCTVCSINYTHFCCTRDLHHPAPQLIHLPMKLFNFSTFFANILLVFIFRL